MAPSPSRRPLAPTQARNEQTQTYDGRRRKRRGIASKLDFKRYVAKDWDPKDFQTETNDPLATKDEEASLLKQPSLKPPPREDATTKDTPVTSFVDKEEDTPITSILQAASSSLPASSSAATHNLVSLYRGSFKDNALDAAQQVSELGIADFQELGVKIGHRKAILRAAEASSSTCLVTVDSLPSTTASLPSTAASTRAPSESEVPVGGGRHATNPGAHEDHTADASTNANNEAFWKDLVKETQKMGADETMIGTLKNYKNFVLWFNNTLGGNFFEIEPEKRAMMLVPKVHDSDWEPSTKRQRLKSFKSFMEALGQYNKLSALAKKTIEERLSIYANQEKKRRRSSIRNANASIVAKDSKHILNSILLWNGGDLPTQELEEFHKISIGQTSGLRKSERLFIAAASWTIHFFKCDDGTTLRGLRFKYCWKKGQPISIRQGFIIETKKNFTHMNAVVITLILLERKGMIPSAEAAYNGTPINIDESQYESAEKLYEKLQLAENIVKKSLQSDLRLDEAQNLDDQVADKLIDAVIKHVDKAGDPVPFYQKYHVGHCTSLRATDNNDGLRRLGVACGYMPSTRRYFGQTAFRSNFRRDSRNGVSSTIDQTSHLNQSAGQSSATALEFYENAIEYCGLIPANILQNSVSVTAIQCLLESIELPAAYEDNTFFRPDWTIQDQDLPPPHEFIRRHARGPDLPLGQPCHAVGCNCTFHYVGDLMLHMKSQHTKSAFACPSLTCKYESRGEISASNYLRGHGNTCRNGGPLSGRKTLPKTTTPPEGMYVFHCPEAGCSFWFRDEHELKRSHKCNADKSKNKKKRSANSRASGGQQKKAKSEQVEKPAGSEASADSPFQLSLVEGVGVTAGTQLGATLGAGEAGGDFEAVSDGAGVVFEV